MNFMKCTFYVLMAFVGFQSNQMYGMMNLFKQEPCEATLSEMMVYDVQHSQATATSHTKSNSPFQGVRYYCSIERYVSPTVAGLNLFVEQPFRFEKVLMKQSSLNITPFKPKVRSNKDLNFTVLTPQNTNALFIRIKEKTNTKKRLNIVISSENKENLRNS